MPSQKGVLLFGSGHDVETIYDNDPIISLPTDSPQTKGQTLSFLKW
jgi:hypothetical protein